MNLVKVALRTKHELRDNLWNQAFFNSVLEQFKLVARIDMDVDLEVNAIEAKVRETVNS